MMYFRKHLLRALLLALILALISVTALAVGTDGFTFERSGDAYTVTGYSGSSESVVVPDWYEGLPVTRIGAGAFEGNQSITTLALPSSIVRIGSGAYRNCSNLMLITTYSAHSAHEWDEGTITTQPTCVDEGVKTFSCTICGTTKAEAVPATGEHTWDEGTITTQPTCVDEGVKTFSCTICGATKSETVPATGEHTWDEGVVTTQPTETEDGVKTFTCTVCGETKTEAVPATGSTTGRIPGDVNDDGAFSLIDILVLIQYNCGQPVAINASNSDVDADGSVTLLDILILIQYNCGQDVTLK